MSELSFHTPDMRNVNVCCQLLAKVHLILTFWLLPFTHLNIQYRFILVCVTCMQRFYYYHWVDKSAGELLVFYCIVCIVVSA